MEEIPIIQSILVSVGLDFNENESELKTSVMKLTSNSIIRLKNLLDFNKNKLSEETFKKYSRFLNDLLRLRRTNMESLEFSFFLNEFDPQIKPTESSFRVVDGISLWALSLCEENNKRQVPNFVQRIEMILRKSNKVMVIFAFCGIKVFAISKKLRLKAIQGVRMWREKRNMVEVREVFLRYRKKVQEKIRMKLIHQKYVEEFKMKNRKIVVEDQKGGWWWMVVVVLVACCFFNSLYRSFV